MTIESVLENFKKIETALSDSSLVKLANENLLKSLTASSMTHEKRSQLIQQFSEQVALNFVNMALDKAMMFDGLVAETNLKNAQKSLVDEQKKTETQQTQNVMAEKELKQSQKAKNTADVALINEQKGLVSNQKATELKKALDIVAETNLKNNQKDLVANQKATELKKANDIVAETNLKNAQKSLVDEQKKTETQQTQNVIAEKELKQSQKAKNTADVGLINEQKGLVANQKATELKKALDIVAETNLKVEQKGLVANQKATELKKALDIVAETNLKNKQKDLANISIYEKQASANKQLGVNIYSNGWNNQGGGLIDAQILGFTKDMRHKILKSLSEQAGMLAQNDVPTPTWMTSEMQSSIYYMKS